MHRTREQWAATNTYFQAERHGHVPALSQAKDDIEELFAENERLRSIPAQHMLDPAAIEAAQKLFDREIYKIDQQLTECEAKGQTVYVKNLSQQRNTWVQHKLRLGIATVPLPKGWTTEAAAKAAWMINTLAITPTDEWRSKNELTSEFRALALPSTDRGDARP